MIVLKKMARFLKPVISLLFILTAFLFFFQKDVIREAVANQSRGKSKFEKVNEKNKIKNSLVRITSIRKFSSENYTRIAVNLEGETKFKYRRIKNPDRVYVDISGAYLDPTLKNIFISVGDGILKKIRSGYFEPKTVRIVVDLERLDTFKVFNLKNPDRIVMDFYGNSEAVSRVNYDSSGKTEDSHLPTLPEQLGLKINRIVIDAGHGGKDTGAIGQNGLAEKDVVLDVAKRLKKIIEEAFHWEVIMTRDNDVFIPLEERTAIANSRKADLFISIHANASRRKEAKGIETYFLNLSSSPDAMEVAARENAVSMKNISDLQKILNDLLLNTKINESSKLAGIVQKNLFQTVNDSFSDTKDLGVKQAPFYVLIGAKMPSILVEISFISNPKEETLLSSEKYKTKISEGIFAGVKTYVESLGVAIGSVKF